MPGKCLNQLVNGVGEKDLSSAERQQDLVLKLTKN